MSTTSSLRRAAETFAGGARAARLALVNGAVGAVWYAGGAPRVVSGFATANGWITGIDLIADPTSLSRLDRVVLHDWAGAKLNCRRHRLDRRHELRNCTDGRSCSPC